MLRKQSNQCQRGTEAAKDGKYWQGSKGARGTSLHTDPVKLMSEFFIFAFVFVFFQIGDNFCWNISWQHRLHKVGR